MFCLHTVARMLLFETITIGHHYFIPITVLPSLSGINFMKAHFSCQFYGAYSFIHGHKYVLALVGYQPIVKHPHIEGKDNQKFI